VLLFEAILQKHARIRTTIAIVAACRSRRLRAAAFEISKACRFERILRLW
jgi:hypothetical protein